MNVVLEPEVEKMVEEQIGSGAYRNADELVNTALRQFLAIRKPAENPKPAREIVEDFPLNMEWERQHRHEHIGEWVALHKGRLIASGKDGGEVFKAAKAQGIEVPFTIHITEQEELPFAGWC